MGAIRTLAVDLVVNSTKAVKSLIAFGREFQSVDRVVATAAASIERNADRVAQALARVSSGAAQVRGAGAGGGGATRTATPRGAARHDNAMARQAGLVDGAKTVRDASAALGVLATKSDRAKAAVADLAAQVARNRKEMADLRAEAVRTGDSEGTLKARMQGLAVATGQASVALQKARGELRAVDGGLIDAVKNAGKLREKFGALQVAAGNLVSGAISTAWHSVSGAIVGATEKAVQFETELTSISKVSRGADDTAEGFAKITAGIKTTATELGVLPTEVASLTAQLAPAFSDVSEGVNGAKVDLVALTGDVTKIGVAWGISGKEAGKSFAEISAGLQITTEQTKSLFGGINEIGNQLGVNAATLAESVQRSAGVLKGANVAGETGAALSAVLIKTGSSAEIAATGVRTFITRLGAGETKGQLKAFETLGLDMKNLRKELANGDAEGQIKKVVAALSGLKNEQRLEVLSELFGTESIGSIGAAATATDLLAQSMSIMGDKTASATSVQKEFDRVSQTSAAKIAKLKANVEVLEIEFGEALLPHINKVVEFLTSPEGKEWGASAVETAVGAVTSLASGIGTVVDVIGRMVEAFGGATVAIGAVGLAAAALTGPFGAALAAGVAAGWGISAAFKAAGDAIMGTTHLIDGAERLRVDAMGRKLSEIDAADAEIRAAGQQRGARELAARKAGAELEAGVLQQAGVKSFSELDKATQASLATRQSKLMIAASEGRNFDEELSGLQAQTGNLGREYEGGGPSGRGGDRARFAQLSAKVRRGQTLRPSEAKEYTRLSKSLDEAKARKAGKGKVHKETKMDRQLAAIGGDVRGVLTSGGERDAGGDLKVHDDVLSRSVFDRATKGGAGGKDRSDGAGIGPGPNITNNYQYVNTTVTVPIDARSQGSPSENIRTAAQQAGQHLGGVVFTGATKVLAQKHAGGVMRSG